MPRLPPALPRAPPPAARTSARAGRGVPTYQETPASQWPPSSVTMPRCPWGRGRGHSSALPASPQRGEKAASVGTGIPESLQTRAPPWPSRSHPVSYQANSRGHPWLAVSTRSQDDSGALSKLISLPLLFRTLPVGPPNLLLPSLAVDSRSCPTLRELNKRSSHTFGLIRWERPAAQRHLTAGNPLSKQHIWSLLPPA